MSKIRDMRPWNVKPGMLIMLGVRPSSSWEGPASDWHEVIDVEKTRGKVTGERCWRITYKSHAYNPPFTGKPESVLRFRDQRVTVTGPVDPEVSFAVAVCPEFFEVES